MQDDAALARALQTRGRKISKNCEMQRFNSVVGNDLGRRALSLFSYSPWLLRNCPPNMNNEIKAGKWRVEALKCFRTQRIIERLRKAHNGPEMPRGLVRPRDAQRIPEKPREA